MNPNASFELQTLELTDKKSRTNLLQRVADKHKKIDVIFNNAAVSNKTNAKGERPTVQIAKTTLEINFHCKNYLILLEIC